MLLKKIFAILILSLLFSLSAYAEGKPGVMGVYTEVPGQQFVFNGKEIEIVEFLSFYCGHCYHFEKSIPVIKGNFPKKIRWKTVPIYWGKGSPKPGEAYLLAEEAGRGEEMKKAIFRAFFIEKKNIGDVEVLENIGLEVGLGFDFSRRLRAGEKAEDVRKAIALSEQYTVNETPTLIVAGNLKVSPGMLNNSVDLVRDNTIVILKSILKK